IVGFPCGNESDSRFVLEWRPAWMAKPYSEDLRARVVGTGQDGATIPETAEQPDITLAELKALLAKEKVTVGQSSIFRFLHHLNLRFKKKSAGRRAGPTGRRRRT